MAILTLDQTGQVANPPGTAIIPILTQAGVPLGNITLAELTAFLQSGGGGGLVLQVAGAAAGQGDKIGWFPISGQSQYDYLPATGIELRQNLSATGDFSTHRTLVQILDNIDQTSDAGSFFPNGGNGLGDDGFMTVNLNTLNIYSTNKQYSPAVRQAMHVTGVAGGAITGVEIDSPALTGYSAATPPSVSFFDVDNQEAVQPTYTVQVNGAGTITGVTIHNGGSGFTAAGNIQAVCDVYPGAPADYDVGAVVNLARGVATANGTLIGEITFQGYLEGATGVNGLYGAIQVQQLSNSVNAPESRIMFATIGPFTEDAGSYPRWYLESGFYLPDSPNGGYDDGWINCNGYAINGVSLFGTANTFTASQQISSPAGSGGPSPTLSLQATGAAPNNTSLGQLTFSAYDAGGTQYASGGIRNEVLTNTAGAPTTRLDFLTTADALVYGPVFFISSGLFTNGATGGDKGSGSINATAVYTNGAALTCYALEHANTGALDLTKWDKLANPTETQAVAATKVPRMRIVSQSVTTTDVKDGVAIKSVATQDVQEHAYEDVPVVDDSGKPVTWTRSVPLAPAKVTNPKTGQTHLRSRYTTETVQRTHRVYLYDDVPAVDATSTPTQHKGARRFAALLGTPYNPTTIDGFTKHWRDKGHLPALPDPATWDVSKGQELGEWVQQLVETVECLALHNAQLHERVKALEAGSATPARGAAAGGAPPPPTA